MSWQIGLLIGVGREHVAQLKDTNRTPAHLHLTIFLHTSGSKWWPAFDFLHINIQL